MREALAARERAEHHAVLWFAEITRRRLHRALGFGSAHLYATAGLGFSSTKACQFVRIAEALGRHRALRDALASGELAWTKAREILDVLTPESAARWVGRAKAISRRELRREVASARAGARRAGDPAQPALRVRAAVSTEAKSRTDTQTEGTSAADASPADASPAGAATAAGAEASDVTAAGETANASASVPSPSGAPNATLTTPLLPDTPPADLPTRITFRLDPVSLARFEALCAALAESGVTLSRDALLLEALEALFAAHTAARRARQPKRRGTRGATARTSPDSSASSAAAPAAAPPAPRSPYQVVCLRCPDCGTGRVATSHGDLPLTREALEALLVDADHIDPEHRCRGSIPPRIRRAVLARDGHRCRIPGCGCRFALIVHHGKKVAAGGPNAIENYVTLCPSCHRALHRHADRLRALVRRTWPSRACDRVDAIATRVRERGPRYDTNRRAGRLACRMRPPHPGVVALPRATATCGCRVVAIEPPHPGVVRAATAIARREARSHRHADGRTLTA